MNRVTEAIRGSQNWSPGRCHGMKRPAFLFLLALGVAASAAELPRRYAIELQDPPLARRVLAGDSLSPSAASQRQKILKAQASIRDSLRRRKLPVVGAVQTLANAVFVDVAPERAAELRALPGVLAVIPMSTLHRKLNKALDLVNASAAWSALGGAANAGAGMKIAVIDTGIDETHPGFKDPSLTMPSGYPKTGNSDDATHATNKIVAVRSFVAALALAGGTAELTRPDDLSARDRVGHGTAVAMIAAGVPHQSLLGTISGVAPKAWLGNYKIFGSPGVNDATTSDVVLQALEAAFNDGMDVALLAAGDLPAVWAPSDSGATCGVATGVACDPFVGAVSTAGLAGMTIVLPAGNDGSLGAGTINSPGDFAGAITVGATTNAHILASTVSTPSGDTLQARLGDGPQMIAALSAPLFPVASIDATEHGCIGYPAGSLNGKIALLTVGQCSYAAKILNAEAAGALAALIFNQAGGPPLYPPSGLGNTAIPAALVSAASGAFLKSYLAAHPGAVVTLNPATAESTLATADTVSYFSSRGPNPGDARIKPDLVAPGSSIYTATQSYDPNGDLYSASGYIGVDGTSFAAAFAAGAAALVKQAHPAYSTGQIQSALVNTANAAITDFDASGNPFPARSTAIGGGKLNIGSAVASTITVVPATVSFGVVNNPTPANGVLATRSVTIANTGLAPASVQLTVRQRDADAKASVAVSPSSVALAAGQSASVTVSLNGSPAAGIYEGAILVAGGAVPAQIPYLYLVGDGTPANQIPLLGQDFTTEAGSAVDVAFRVVDRYGVPVANMPVRFAPPAAVYASSQATDRLGIAEAYMYTSAATVQQLFTADLIGNAGRAEFDGRVRTPPQINANGVVDAASFLAPAGFAPGSYISIFGAGLSEGNAMTRTLSLPISLAGASVSFDVPAANIHVPARLHFVSPGQINLQIPWELAGQASATLKVTLSGSSSKNVRADNSSLGTFQTQTASVPMAAFSPAFFEYADASSGKRLAAVLDENYALITPANPAQRGHAVQFFVNGLGAVSNQPASGEASPALPLALTQASPTVTIGGQSATVQFSGMSPGSVGLYQVNAVIPQGVSAGLQAAVISIGGIDSKATLVPVQ